MVGRAPTWDADQVRDGAGQAERRAPDGELAQQLRGAVRSRVGRHAYPRVVALVTPLPWTETGRPQRARLRELHRTAGTHLW